MFVHQHGNVGTRQTGTSPGHDPGKVEGFQSTGNVQDDIYCYHVPYQRYDDACDGSESRGAIEQSAFKDLLWNRLNGRKIDEEVNSHVLPQLRHRNREYHNLRIRKPIMLEKTETEGFQDIVEYTVIAVQQEGEQESGRYHRDDNRHKQSGTEKPVSLADSGNCEGKNQRYRILEEDSHGG